MKHLKKLIWSITLAFVGSSVFAQGEYQFSLVEAQNYALENSFQTRLAQMDVEQSESKVRETIGIGLPQVNASASYNNYLELPVQLIPSESFGGPAGEFTEVVFGTEQQMGFDATATQLIFNGAYFVGLQATRVYVDLAKNQQEKTEIEIKNLILTAYGNVLVAERNALISKAIFEQLKSNFEEAEEFYKEGFVSQENKDQLELLYITARNNYQQSERLVPITRDQLNFAMGIDLDAQLMLTDSIEQIIESLPDASFLDKEFDLTNHIDMRTINTQLQATELLLKEKRSNYLPTLNAFYTYQENSFSNDFDFFSDAPWFPTQLVGLQFNLPVFSGFSRKNRVEQAKIDVNKVELSRQQVERELQINADRAKSDYLFALQQYQNSKQNWELAKRIYLNTEEKYREGMSSSTDLTQANNQLEESQGDYVRSALQLIQAKAELNKALNLN